MDYNASNDAPLHKALHYRRIREVIHLIADYENEDISHFDLNDLTVYEITGKQFHGRDVSVICNDMGFRDVQTAASCWVSGNKYDVIEAQLASNTSYEHGTFLVLTNNIELDTFHVATMNIYENEVHFDLWGSYRARMKDGRIESVMKLRDATNCLTGFDSNDSNFDRTVRLNAYKGKE